MTPLGANDSTVSQTKHFSTLMSLSVFHRNKKKKGKSMNQHSFSKSHYTFSRVDLLERQYFSFMFPSKFSSVSSSFLPFK